MLLVCVALVASARPAVAEPPTTRLRLGAHAVSFVQPGVRLSVPVDLHAHDRGAGRAGMLFVSPHLGLFGGFRNHVSLQLGGALGYRFLTPRRGRFHELGVGGGYVAEWQITSLEVNLGTGRVDNRRVLRSYFLPHARYLFGREGSGRLGGYVGVTAGALVSRQLEASLFLDVEVGLQLRLGGAS